MPYTRHRIPRVHIHAPSIHQPSKGWGLILIAIVVGFFAGAGWKLYELGGARAGYDREKTAVVIAELQEQLDYTEAERDQYRQRAVNMERSVQIDREAVRELREEIKKLQNERHKWREETELVKKLLSDNSIDSALRIMAFEISPLDTEREYSFEAVISRVPDSSKAIKATLEFEVIGIEAGEVKTYTSAELSDEDEKAYQIDFKHLERVRGAFTLPEIFQPQTIRVSVKGGGDATKDAEREFIWMLE